MNPVIGQAAAFTIVFLLLGLAIYWLLGKFI